MLFIDLLAVWWLLCVGKCYTQKMTSTKGTSKKKKGQFSRIDTNSKAEFSDSLYPGSSFPKVQFLVTQNKVCVWMKRANHIEKGMFVKITHGHVDKGLKLMTIRNFPIYKALYNFFLFHNCHVHQTCCSYIV